MRTVNKLLSLLTNNQRKRAFILLFMVIIMALLDMAGVASIIPFMTVLTNPDIINTNSLINIIYEHSNNYGINNHEHFLFILGIIVFLLLIISLVFKSLTTYFQLRFILNIEYSLARRLLNGYLNQPYSWFLNRHSADLGKTILSEVGIICGSGLYSLLRIITHSIVVIALISLLLFVNPKLTIVSILILGTSYGIFYIFVRGFLNKIGQERFEANKKRFTAISEAFGAFKEVKMSGLEANYVDRFADPAKKYVQQQASAEILKQIPRYGLEIIVFGGLLLLVLYLINQGDTFSSSIPLIALFAFAGYRLMPALQLIYGSITELRFIGPALDNMYDDLKGLKLTGSQKIGGSLKLKKSINLKNIFYNYPNQTRTVLKNISVNIPAYSTFGIVGSTGSGKTSVVDIILGLLDAQKGSLEVDDIKIGKDNRRAWQNSIGYVPQQIFLADDSISANIAFGLDKENIDNPSIIRAAKIANLHDFVMNELPFKYQTKVGEHGIRLSGGQRQRIGIARALYHNPQVLILDEATNSLDITTEDKVMNEVYDIDEKITIILISHRLSTVKKCDSIIVLEKGEIISQGSFEDLININDNFKLSAKKN